MKQKAFVLQNKGMNRDLSISKAGESSAYENHNIRILARDHDTLLSVTNERGNKEIILPDLPGELVGWNVLNNHIILFMHKDAKPYSGYEEIIPEEEIWDDTAIPDDGEGSHDGPDEAPDDYNEEEEYGEDDNTHEAPYYPDEDIITDGDDNGVVEDAELADEEDN